MPKYTPMMEQYLQVKKQYMDAIVFYRVGDFYEMFFDDAKVASRELDLVLTGKSAGVEERVPMCGIPFHAYKNYAQKLVLKGYKVAIIEQMEDPKETKTIVKRDCIQIITPGTIMDEDENSKNSSCIAAIYDYQYGLSLAVCEMTTGETFVKNIKKSTVELQQTLLRNTIREIVVQESFDEKLLKGVRDLGCVTISYCNRSEIDEEYKPLIEEIEDERILIAYGLLLNYLVVTQKRMMHHLQTVKQQDDSQVLYMDFSTQQNLELIMPLRANAKTETLWSFLDRCKCAMGSRLLKKWVEFPMTDQKKIEHRLDRVQMLNENFMIREELKDQLKEIYDLERLIARVAYGSANAVDCIRLYKTIRLVPNILNLLKDYEVFEELKRIDPCEDLCMVLENAFVENPPISTKEGGMFKDGYNATLDEYRSVQRGGKQWLVELESKEKERTGIRTLKIGYNRVFGYYIEVSKGMVPMVKDEFGYVRKQTLTTGERYITQELKEKEDAILHAEERAVRLENQLFEELIDKIKTYLPKLQRMSLVLADLDATYALSSISSEYGYVRPQFTEDKLILVEGRHPILDQKLKEKRYVSNSISMNQDQSILLITGPNMGGKSTYMRQVALIVVLAQMGCFVPCKSAEMPIFDKIFTRIGASDDILGGQSTFMVEMTEANNALSLATEKSLILFDEIGRGTSTYDGMALAQSMIEYIASCIHAKTLFSTHYHELTQLEDTMDTIKNVHVEVHEEEGTVTFMYRVKPGRADRSYGINVARLAKLPESVLTRAQELLHQLESKKRVVQQSFGFAEPMVKESASKSVVEEKLEMVDPNSLTPMQALLMIQELKSDLKK